MKNLPSFILGLSFCFLFSLSAFCQYEFYPADGNQFSQKILETSDGNRLIYAAKDCYTPGSITIEGCINRIALHKVDQNDDLIWSKEIPYYTQYSTDKLEVFENADGGFTIFAVTNQSYNCDGIYIGLSGFRQVQIFNLDSDANLIIDTTFPESCEQTLIDVEEIANNQFAMLSYFNSPFSTIDATEGRLSIIDGQGVVTKEIYFPLEKFKAAKLVVENSVIELIYFDKDEIMRLNKYDFDLNPISDSENSTFANSCFSNSVIRSSFQKLSTDDWAITCFDWFADFENVSYFQLDDSFELVAENKLTLIQPTNLFQLKTDALVIASTALDDLGGKDVQVTTLSLSGDSLSSATIAQGGDEQPNFIAGTIDEEYFIVGNQNCCNYEQAIGPGVSFLTTRSANSNGLAEKHPNLDFTIFPNPTFYKTTIYVNSMLPSDKEQGTQLILYAPSGQILLTQEVVEDQLELDLSPFPVGLFLFSVRTTNGHELGRGKVIKTK